MGVNGERAHDGVILKGPSSPSAFNIAARQASANEESLFSFRCFETVKRLGVITKATFRRFAPLTHFCVKNSGFSAGAKTYEHYQKVRPHQDAEMNSPPHLCPEVKTATRASRRK